MLIISTAALKILASLVITIMVIINGYNYEKFEANKNKQIKQAPVAHVVKHLDKIKACTL